MAGTGTTIIDLGTGEETVRLRTSGLESATVRSPSIDVLRALRWHYRRRSRASAPAYVNQLLAACLDPPRRPREIAALPESDRARLRHALVLACGNRRKWKALHGIHLTPDERLFAIDYWEWEEQQRVGKRITVSHHLEEMVREAAEARAVIERKMGLVPTPALSPVARFRDASIANLIRGYRSPVMDMMEWTKRFDLSREGIGSVADSIAAITRVADPFGVGAGVGGPGSVAGSIAGIDVCASAGVTKSVFGIGTASKFTTAELANPVRTLTHLGGLDVSAYESLTAAGAAALNSSFAFAVAPEINANTMLRAEFEQLAKWRTVNSAVWGIVSPGATPPTLSKMLADWKGPLGFLSDTMLRTFAASVAPQVMPFAAQWQEMVKLQTALRLPGLPEGVLSWMAPWSGIDETLRQLRGPLALLQRALEVVDRFERRWARRVLSFLVRLLLDACGVWELQDLAALDSVGVEDAVFYALEGVLADGEFVPSMRTAVAHAPHLTDTQRTHLDHMLEHAAEQEYVHASAPLYAGLEGAFWEAAYAGSVITEQRTRIDRPTKEVAFETMIKSLGLDHEFQTLLVRGLWGTAGNPYRHRGSTDNERRQVLLGVAALAGWLEQFARVWAREELGERMAAALPAAIARARPLELSAG